jgi:hypothetical protein
MLRQDEAQVAIRLGQDEAQGTSGTLIPSTVLHNISLGRGQVLVCVSEANRIPLPLGNSSRWSCVKVEG